MSKPMPKFSIRPADLAPQKVKKPKKDDWGPLIAELAQVNGVFAMEVEVPEGTTARGLATSLGLRLKGHDLHKRYQLVHGEHSVWIVARTGAPQ